jgi:hypothetical protein
MAGRPPDPARAYRLAKSPRIARIRESLRSAASPGRADRWSPSSWESPSPGTRLGRSRATAELASVHSQNARERKKPQHDVPSSCCGLRFETEQLRLLRIPGRFSRQAAQDARRWYRLERRHDSSRFSGWLEERQSEMIVKFFSRRYDQGGSRRQTSVLSERCMECLGWCFRWF